jgi:spectinomycin phosphotransferase
LVARADLLGERLKGTNLTPVLCHADLRTWNVLLDGEQQLRLVDWDETVLALKERDLMFVAGGSGAELVKPPEQAQFLRGYGEDEVDPLALAFYRYAWAIGDMGSFAEMVYFMPEAGQATRQDAVRKFICSFEPGSFVALAHAAYDPKLDDRLA